MKKLNAGEEAPPPPSYTVVSTAYDEVVTPYKSQALTGATNVVLQDRCPEDVTDHVGIIYDPIALQWTLERARPRPGPPTRRSGRCAATPARQRCRSCSPPRARAAGRRRRAGVRIALHRRRRPLRRPRSCCATARGRLGTERRRHRGRHDAGRSSVPLQRAAAPAASTATVLTFQPGGYVNARCSYPLRRKHSG